MINVRKGRIISENDKTSINVNVLDLGTDNNFIFFMGNCDNKITNNSITINGYIAASIPRSGVSFEYSGLIRKHVPGLYPWCKKYIDIFEDPNRKYRFEVSKQKTDNYIQYPSSLSSSISVPITGQYKCRTLPISSKEAFEIDSLIPSIVNGLNDSRSNNNYENDYFQLIFVGDHETMKGDEQFADISFNPNVKFEQLPSDIGTSNMTLPTELKNKIDKLNLYYKKYRPLTYNGTPKPGAYFDSNVAINKKLGKHRLGIVYGTSENIVKSEIEKLNSAGFGVADFFKIHIYSSWQEYNPYNFCFNSHMCYLTDTWDGDWSNKVRDMVIKHCQTPPCPKNCLGKGGRPTYASAQKLLNELCGEIEICRRGIHLIHI